MQEYSLNWRNLQANTLESLATESGDSVTNVMQSPSLPGKPMVCRLNGQHMRCSEAKSRVIAKLESMKLNRVIGATD